MVPISRRDFAHNLQNFETSYILHQCKAPLSLFKRQKIEEIVLALQKEEPHNNTNLKCRTVLNNPGNKFCILQKPIHLQEVNKICREKNYGSGKRRTNIFTALQSSQSTFPYIISLNPQNKPIKQANQLLPSFF